jgi:acetyl esterase
MNLDPQLLRVLASVTATYDFPIDWNIVRRDSKDREASLAGPGGVAQVRAVEQHRLDAPGGVPDVRVYRPEGAPTMTIIHFHGGGWTLGDLDTADHTARKICRQMGAIVISCTYRLAPENPFPTAFEDALAATRWALSHIEELGGDPQRVVIAGDSAGGNLVAAVTIALRDDPRIEQPALRAQLLLYPGVDVRDSALQAPSYLADLDPSTRAAMLDVCIKAYVQCGSRGDWRVSPLAAADLSCLPPALVVVLSVDPLRDQGVMYAQRLQEAGVACELIEYPHLTHGFCHIAALVPAADEAFDEVLARFGQFVNFERGGNC